MSYHPSMPATFVTLFRPVLCAALALAGACAHAQDAYRLKADEPETGSHINRTAVSGSVIPFNKRYDELSPEQQPYLKSHCEQMGEGDEPPFPAQGIGFVLRAISQLQQRFLVKGQLLLVVDVDSQGVAQNVRAAGDFDPAFVKAASTVLLLTPFKPAKCKGQPCRMAYPYRAQFSVRY